VYVYLLIHVISTVIYTARDAGIYKGKNTAIHMEKTLEYKMGRNAKIYTGKRWNIHKKKSWHNTGKC
jgi:hypothetical protein